MELKRLVTYSTREFLADFMTPFIFSVLMGFGVDLVRCYGLPMSGISSMMIKLIVEVAVGGVLYVLFAIVFRLGGYVEMMNIRKEKRAAKG